MVTVNPVYLTLLNFNVFLKTCVLTFIIITISQCVLVRKHIVPSDYYCQARISYLFLKFSTARLLPLI